MRIALVSDVHANLAALEAVLAEADRAGAEQLWCMGDMVGYGAEPDAVIARLREAGAQCVMGNHDAAALGKISIDDFNANAAAAARWTAETISPETRDYLEALPLTLGDDFATRCHGTLANPIWEYLVTYPAALGHFALQTTPCSVVGHTHVPLFIRKPGEGEELDIVRPGDGDVVELGAGLVCINPGGVGQPRDGDPRACWALLDTAAGHVTFHRVPYDIATTQRLITEAGLPPQLAARLALGR
ncbi:MAG: metallophosphoesterase family protein [Dehalococcoidia bacterium]|nr:metallophosphoesterase family protein [Dehalococcoidia bacterium]